MSAAGVALPRPTEGLTLGLAVSGGDSRSGSGAALSLRNSLVLARLR